MFQVPNKFRVKNSKNAMFNSTDADGNNGHFLIRKKNFSPGVRDKKGFLKQVKNNKDTVFLVKASDTDGWEHIRIQIVGRSQMIDNKDINWIRDHFWSKEDIVIQYHCPDLEIKGDNEFFVHLWRFVDGINVPDVFSIKSQYEELLNMENNG